MVDHSMTKRGHSGQIGTVVTGTHNFFLFQKRYFIQRKKYSCFRFLSQIKISWLGSQIIGLEPMMVSEATPSPYLDAEIVTLHQLGFNWLA